MRHVSTGARPENACTYCQVVDSHAAQGPAVVAEIVLDGRISHLGRESTAVGVQISTLHTFRGESKQYQLNSSVAKLWM